MSALVKYAGYDPSERFPSRYVFNLQNKRHRAYVMFRAGRDTLEIAKAFKITEAKALRWINERRSQLRGLPLPYEARP